MKCVVPTGGCSSLEHGGSEDILDTDPVRKKSVRCKQNGLHHVRTESLRHSKEIRDCSSIGRQRPGRPLKTLIHVYSDMVRSFICQTS